MKKVKTSPKQNSPKLNDRQRILIKIKKEVKLSKEEEEQSKVHVLKKGIICDTEARGYATPQGKSPFEIVVDASEGFV
ncbi:MAG: hypothetical protein H0U27_07975, partial [Nitrosopumilus sp.]|nr:hypothetical protein [Nitrosopumilus sp.]